MPPLIPIIVIYVGILVLIAIIGHIGAALTSLDTANAPMDEREAQIVARATSLSDYIMGVGILISLGLYLLNYDGNQLFHLVIGTLMLAQFAQYAVQIMLMQEFGDIILGVVIVTVILHAVIAAIFDMRKRKDAFEKDERDIEIERKGAHWGYRLMQWGVGGIIVMIFLHHMGGSDFIAPISIEKTAEIIFALLVVSYVADLVKQGIHSVIYFGLPLGARATALPLAVSWMAVRRALTSPRPISKPIWISAALARRALSRSVMNPTRLKFCLVFLRAKPRARRLAF